MAKQKGKPFDFTSTKLSASAQGELIVFEGADGSGKTTQSKLLVKKISAKYISFPRYDESMWGAMVARYLKGEFGGLDEVDPYLVSMLYAGDRALAKDEMRRWLASGETVVCNRYIGSNIAHQAAKLQSPNSKLQFIKWLEKLEYGENRIPKEDLVIFLYVPVEVSWKLMEGRRLDIHEKDREYLARVIDVYDDYARTHKNWVKVDCAKGGKILLPDEIHKKVLSLLSQKQIL